MKSERSLRLYRERNHQKKQSNSPTIASSYSEKRLWTKNYKNQPFPRALKRRLIGHQFHFSDFSDEQEDNNGIVLQEEQSQVFQKKKKLLPHFKIISDRGQFIGNRSRIKSEQKFGATSQRCKSVQSLKLPQVMEEKKQEDDLQKLARFKISDFKDKNQFNQRSNRNSENNSNHDNQALEPNIYTSTIPIIQNDAQQTKSQKVKNDKSILTVQLQKIIVDQIDDKKKVQQQQIEQIIEQQKLQQEFINLKPLRFTLDKIQQQTELFQKFKEEELYLSSHNSEKSDRSEDGKQKVKKKRHEPNETITQ